jgi:hypothetical protein
MARVIKIDNALQKRFSSKQNNNKKNRELVAYFLIVCEGEKTEPNYFRSFPKQIGKMIFDIEFEGGGISTIKVVEKAIKLRDNSKQKYDRVWAVFDRDSFSANSFNSAISKAEANGVFCAWSNEAFELWYLLHFQNRNTAMKREEYQKAIENAVNKKSGTPKKLFIYKKNNTEMYALLQKLGNQDLAIKRAKKLKEEIEGKNFASYNPQTQVFQLVEELIGRSERLNEEIRTKYAEGK